MSVKNTNAESRMRFLESELTKMSKAYYQDERPIASDSEYDKLYDELVSLEKSHPELKNPNSPTSTVSSDLSSFLQEKEHTVPVLSLDKAYSVDEINAFVNRCIKECGKDVSFTLEEKIDGLSLVLYYKKGRLETALTRGNGHIGNDVTASALRIKSIPKTLKEPIDIAVRGEVYISKDNFERINSTLDEPYSNARNLASGILRRLENNENSKSPLPLDIFVYEGWADEIDRISEHPDMLNYLHSLGFRTNDHIIIFKDSFDVTDAIKAKTEERKTLGYDIDGLVLKLNSFKMREHMGYTEHHPRWAIAYKFDSPSGKSKILSIDITVGRTGKITPRANLAPLNLLGATITKATLHNSSYIEELELSIGDEVSVSRRGDVIPAVDEVLEKNPDGNPIFHLPSTCPCCGEKLHQKGANLFCINENCSERIQAEAEYFVSKDCMNIDGVGASVIKDLLRFDAIKDYTDLYFINYNEVLTGKPGYKEKKIQAIINSVQKSKDEPFTHVLAAVGIEGIGLASAERLVNARIDSFEKFIALSEKDDVTTLQNIDEIGEITAKTILSTFRNPTFRRKIERLKEAGLNTETKASDFEMISNALEGQSWCVTGSILGYKNPDLAMIEVKKRGARVVSGVSKKTTHLLVGSNPGSKLQKAIGFGTTLIHDTEFKAFLEDVDKKEGL